MSANVFITKDYENETSFRPKKTNPIKPNFKCPQTHQRSGKEKGIRNFFWLSVAGKDILYGKSRFSLKFGENSFDCLSFRSLL